MIVKEFEPKSEVLKKYIKSFYFMNSGDNVKTEFIYYPHFIETINIFSNASVNINNQVFNVDKQQDKTTIILSAGKTQFRTAVINNAYDIIGIQFFPLAIHSFFNINTYPNIEVGVFEMSHNKALNMVGELDDIEQRQEALETFFIDSLNNKPLEKLSAMVQLIHNSKGNIRMHELESSVNLSRRTILRQFRKYLHCSFEDYKNTVRFRLAIQNFTGKNENTSNLIADIAYYDQSDFINHFKALAGESPKKLLKHITNNPESTNYFWKLKQV